ncbi:MAG TPA: hypothetical protein VMZ71_09105 [Gemmataceae bacterium]|nr:hypothetical protein [Gemmataceae bacterium]
MLCKTCGGTRVADQGLDVEKCKDCQPDLRIVREVIAASSDEHLTEEDVFIRRQFETLADRYEELVAVLAPMAWQTPRERAQELVDNMVVIAQIKELASRS